MDSNKKANPGNSPSRRKFVWGVGIVSAFAAISAAVNLPFFRKRPSAKNKTIRMLTEDGRLVEIDQSLALANKKKVTNTELQHWIKK